MEWIRENWVFILFAVFFIGMHFFGHGMHGGSGRGHNGRGEGHKGHTGEGEGKKDEKGGRGCC